MLLSCSSIPESGRVAGAPSLAGVRSEAISDVRVTPRCETKFEVDSKPGWKAETSPAIRSEPDAGPDVGPDARPAAGGEVAERLSLSSVICCCQLCRSCAANAASLPETAIEEAVPARAPPAPAPLAVSTTAAAIMRGNNAAGWPKFAEFG